MQLAPTKFKLVIVKTFFFWVSDLILIVKTKIINKNTFKKKKKKPKFTTRLKIFFFFFGIKVKV